MLAVLAGAAVVVGAVRWASRVRLSRALVSVVGVVVVLKVPIVAIVVMGAGVGVGASLLAGAAAVASVGCRRGGWLSLWALLVVAAADVVGSAG